ncbi:hypothetical protein VE02_01444 [Pseudogymnoascus sp. 03VT05]|nr:hypothetical protein VE02_01444 [Pseudogymnoascus sp. 03VT05]
MAAATSSTEPIACPGRLSLPHPRYSGCATSQVSPATIKVDYEESTAEGGPASS